MCDIIQLMCDLSSYLFVLTKKTQETQEKKRSNTLQIYSGG